MSDRPLASILIEIYRRLLTCYGAQGWWPGGDNPISVIVGAILTQNTSWANATKAIDNLVTHHLLSASALRDISDEDLAQIIRPSGYFNAKAKTLKAMATFIGLFDDDIESWGAYSPKILREQLLTVRGIGPETADDIVLYAAKLPSFVIDRYTCRILSRLGLLPRDHNYTEIQNLFESNLANEERLFNEYHALLDVHAKETCKKTAPLCIGCCLRDICIFGSPNEADIYAEC